VPMSALNKGKTYPPHKTPTIRGAVWRSEGLAVWGGVIRCKRGSVACMGLW